MRERLTGAIGDLPERERLVMTLYYYEETTMKEIGLILGVVESRISQIHASAVLHLRARLADFAAGANHRLPAGALFRALGSQERMKLDGPCAHRLSRYCSSNGPLKSGLQLER